MKITGPDILQRQSGSIRSPNGKDTPDGFKNLLGEKLGRSGSSAAAPKSAPLSEPLGIYNTVQPAYSPQSFADRASQAIDLLDAYSSALSDPGKTLRDIEPELTAFVSETQSLYDDYLLTDQTDPQLKSIMEDLLRTAKLEGIRFQRGDYLDSE